MMLVGQLKQENKVSNIMFDQFTSLILCSTQKQLRGGGRGVRLVQAFENNLNLTITGPTRTLEVQSFDP